MKGALQAISGTTYLMPFTTSPVSHGPTPRQEGAGGLPFQVVIRRPIVAAVNSHVGRQCSIACLSLLSSRRASGCGSRDWRTFPTSRRRSVAERQGNRNRLSHSRELGSCQEHGTTAWPPQYSQYHSDVSNLAPVILSVSQSAGSATESRSPLTAGAASQPSPSRTPHAVTLEPGSQLPELGRPG